MRMLLIAMLALVLIVIVLAATRPGTTLSAPAAVTPMVTAATPKAAPAMKTATIPYESTSASIERDWHPTGGGIEVRWINDDPFSHVGGHCYARETDGSTRTASGQSGLVRVGEKLCIAAGAKDTPFDVPDRR